MGPHQTHTCAAGSNPQSKRQPEGQEPALASHHTLGYLELGNERPSSRNHEETFSKDNKQAHEEKLHTTRHQGPANQNHNKPSSPAYSDDVQQNTKRRVSSAPAQQPAPKTAEEHRRNVNRKRQRLAVHGKAQSTKDTTAGGATAAPFNWPGPLVHTGGAEVVLTRWTYEPVPRKAGPPVCAGCI